jgi:hypothetical protein
MMTRKVRCPYCESKVTIKPGVGSKGLTWQLIDPDSKQAVNDVTFAECSSLRHVVKIYWITQFLKATNTFKELPA